MLEKAFWCLVTGMGTIALTLFGVAVGTLSDMSDSVHKLNANVAVVIAEMSQMRSEQAEARAEARWMRDELMKIQRTLPKRKD